MKILKYKVIGSIMQTDPKTKQSALVETLVRVVKPYTEENEAAAAAESYNGEYTIADDGVEKVIESSQLDLIEAQVTYTAMMTDTLLEV